MDHPLNKSIIPRTFITSLRSFSQVGITLFFMALWTIIAINRFGEFHLFMSSMRSQPLANWINETLILWVPVTELLAALLLCFNTTRKIGMYLSCFLMLSYSLYVLLILSKVLGNIPCSCSSPIPKLSWVQHLWFNLSLTGLAGLWIYLNRKSR